MSVMFFATQSVLCSGSSLCLYSIFPSCTSPYSVYAWLQSWLTQHAYQRICILNTTRRFHIRHDTHSNAYSFHHAALRMDHSVKKLYIQPHPIIWRAVAPHCNCGTGNINWLFNIACFQFLASCRFQSGVNDTIQSFKDAVIRNCIAVYSSFWCGLAAAYVSLRCLCSARWAGHASLPKAFGKALLLFC